jgi:hypothetical protein
MSIAHRTVPRTRQRDVADRDQTGANCQEQPSEQRLWKGERKPDA